ncbi:MAG: M14 family zinc carboxypeptidase [Pyrinomonadaceae bacterium]
MMIKVSRLFALSAIFFCASLFGQTERSFDFYASGPYKANVPTPQSVLRFDVGEHHTTYAQMEAVIESIQKAVPERVRIFDIGMTAEKRMQHIVAISSPENMARLDEIKKANARLADPRETNGGAASSITASNPAIAWMAYTIHGNESSSFEAMMQVVYQLAASESAATQEILKNTVVLVITGENPDGHERFATWYNSVAVGDPNPAALEHNEPWSIWGRYNHYRFDLNRDNIAITQKETENMNRAYFEWNPQVAVDHHGQPSQFFFPPAALPINPNLPQPTTNKWLDVFGRANAKSFDSEGWDYYVRDIFDLFYAGYWDSMPSLNGAIGMTYETDGGGFKGLNFRRDDGTIVTFRSSIAKHYIASMTTLSTLAANREQRLKDFYQFRVDAISSAKTRPMKRIVILPERDPVKAAELADILLKSKIEVRRTRAPFRSSTAHSYMFKDAPREAKEFPTGALIVDLDQAQGLWAKGLLEQDTPQDPEFVADNMERFKRNEMRGAGTPKEPYGFYDITAWNPPLAFDLETYWTEDASNVASDQVTQSDLGRIKAADSIFEKARIAYVLPYNSDNTGVMAVRLVQEGFRVNVSIRKLNAAGQNFPEGTFVVRVTRNSEAVHDAVRRLAGELGVKVIPVQTGYTEEGDTGVGGENVLPLKGARIAMLADEVVSQTSFGSTWWTLDQKGVKFTPLSVLAVKQGGLNGYDVMIIPDASAGDLAEALGEGGIGTLKAWIAGGGSLITMRGSSVFATLKQAGLSTSTLVGGSDSNPAENASMNDDTDATKRADKAEPFPVLPPISSPSASAGRIPEGIPGSIMRATVDRTTYLNYGVRSDEMPVLLASGYFFNYSKEGSNALIFRNASKNPLTISGFVWEGNTERLLAGTSYLIDEQYGRGHVVMFAEDVFFRGIFRSTTRQFFNAVAMNGVF